MSDRIYSKHITDQKQLQAFKLLVIRLPEQTCLSSLHKSVSQTHHFRVWYTVSKPGLLLGTLMPWHCDEITQYKITPKNASHPTHTTPLPMRNANLHLFSTSVMYLARKSKKRARLFSLGKKSSSPGTRGTTVTGPA